MIALASLSESARKIALDRFRLLQPHLEEKRLLKAVARDAGIGYRTAERWMMRYRKYGFAGLARDDRADHRVVRHLPADLVMLAHEGSKAHREAFELIHRREADRPNGIWQADHCLLDILLVRDGTKPAKPWLTVIQDYYSRAVAGYFLFYEAPSTVQTALVLRQAIWRKDDPRWHVCGIPDE